MKAYISLPITGRDLDKQKRLAESAKQCLLNNTIISEVITPFDIDGYAERQQWEWYLAKDLMVILSCDVVVMLKGWQDSIGCKLEHEWASINNKEIITSTEQINKYKKS